MAEQQGSGAPLGKRKGSYTAGNFTTEATAERQMIAELVAECRAVAKVVDESSRVKCVGASLAAQTADQSHER